MSAAPKLLAAAAVLGLGAVALVSLSSGESKSGAAGDVEPTDLPVLIMSAGERAAHIGARPVIIEAARRVLGRDATPAELQYIHGVAWAETNYGRGWGPAMASANNWGAVSCNPATENESTCVPGQTDHTSDNVAYTTGFRRYATPVDGAAHTVQHILKLRPRTASALAGARPSTHRASLAMRREKYYGGFCPKAVAAHGKPAGSLAAWSQPDRDEGSQACEREAETSHAETVFRNARAVAQALGEPLALRLGTYDDARKWWGSSSAPVAGPDDDEPFRSARPRVVKLAALEDPT